MDFKCFWSTLLTALQIAFAWLFNFVCCEHVPPRAAVCVCVTLWEHTYYMHSEKSRKFRSSHARLMSLDTSPQAMIGRKWQRGFGEFLPVDSVTSVLIKMSRDTDRTLLWLPALSDKMFSWSPGGPGASHLYSWAGESVHLCANVVGVIRCSVNYYVVNLGNFRCRRFRIFCLYRMWYLPYRKRFAHWNE